MVVCFRRLNKVAQEGPQHQFQSMRMTPILAIAAGFLLMAGDLAAQPGGNPGTPIGAGESCPPGMTEFRPRRCMAPTTSPPSILDYRPVSTLVVPPHVVPRAKYPAIDFHGHPQGSLASVDALARLGASLD